MKRGVSAVVATVLLIALTLAVVGIVWAVVNNLVQEKIKTTESCGVLNEVELNQLYTCYNNTAGTDELWFSINVGEVESLEDIFIAISGGGAGVTFKIGDDPAELSSYPNRIQQVNIPGKESGLTYIYQLPVSISAPELIEIAPIINGELCSVSSSIDFFDDCASLAS